MIKVNVGCGKWNFGKDWHHIDIAEHSHIESNQIHLSDFEDESVNIVYSSHFLEYFDKEAGEDLLSIWRKKLTKGGKLQIAVPDFAAICKIYQGGGYGLRDILGPLFGKMEGRRFEYIYHKTVYDPQTLFRILNRCGFVNIKQLTTGFYPDIKDQSWAYLPDRDYKTGKLISLNVECEKI